MPATRSITASVCSSVVPGTISSRMRLKSESKFGKNCIGTDMISMTDQISDPSPMPTIQVR